MDTRKRIEAARARLRELQLDERRAEQAGPPCVDCIHYVGETQPSVYSPPIPPRCGHLAYTDRRFDVAKGQFIENTAVSAADARKDDGLCGPEGILFDKGTGLRKDARNALFAISGMGLIFVYLYWPILFH